MPNILLENSREITPERIKRWSQSKNNTQLWMQLVVEVKNNEEGKVCLERYLGRPLDFPGSSDGKASAYNTGDPGSIPGSGRSPGEGNGNPLQYSCPENLMDRGAWRDTVERDTNSRTQLKQLNMHACMVMSFF